MHRDIVDILSDINQIFMNHDSKKNTNMLERYHWFKNNSDQGVNCRYARLCHHRFLDADFEKVKPLIIEAAEALQQEDTND